MKQPNIQELTVIVNCKEKDYKAAKLVNMLCSSLGNKAPLLIKNTTEAKITVLIDIDGIQQIEKAIATAYMLGAMTHSQSD